MSDPTDPRPLNVEEAQEIADTIEYRQGRFLDEPLAQSIMVVLLNAGGKWVPVRCVGGEWSGTKDDLPRREDGGVPLCPNGHPLLETGAGKKLGYVPDIEMERLLASFDEGEGS